VRITGGELGGRALQVPRGGSVRPTADRVREALFSFVGDLSGAVVLDGYAGTGALGIEALSRGAARAVFLERSARVLRVLRSNLDQLNLGERSEVHRGDAVQALRRLASSDPARRFDWAFLDPPYRGPEARRLLNAIDELSVMAADGRVMVETSRFFPLDPDLMTGRYRRVDERRYGDTVLVYLAPGQAGSNGAV
jgi:16S rRNA (guanine(966)-N(2))-methyltransferase RsmD